MEGSKRNWARFHLKRTFRVQISPLQESNLGSWIKVLSKRNKQIKKPLKAADHVTYKLSPIQLLLRIKKFENFLGSKY